MTVKMIPPAGVGRHYFGGGYVDIASDGTISVPEGSVPSCMASGFRFYTEPDPVLTALVETVTGMEELATGPTGPTGPQGERGATGPTGAGA